LTRPDSLGRRDAALREHIERLGEALQQYESQSAAAAAALLDEAAGLEQTEPHLGEEPRARLAALRGRLAEVTACTRGAARLQAEMSDLQAAQAANLDELHRLHAAWKAASDALVMAQAREKTKQPGAAEEARGARSEVQRAEGELRAERARLVAISAAHRPEYLVQEPLLRLCEVDGAALPGVRAVTRSFASVLFASALLSNRCASSAHSSTTSSARSSPGRPLHATTFSGVFSAPSCEHVTHAQCDRTTHVTPGPSVAAPSLAARRARSRSTRSTATARSGECCSARCEASS
jgi:hypothetical protein